MKIIILIATIYVFAYSVVYSRSEIKKYKNYAGATIIQLFRVLATPIYQPNTFHFLTIVL